MKKVKFTVDVGKMSTEEAEKEITKLMKDYKERDPYVDYWFPSNKNISVEELEVTEDEIWNELTSDEKEERRLSKQEQDEIFRETGFVDWNQYDLDYLADYLENKYMLSSTGEAFAIFKLIHFYRTHK